MSLGASAQPETATLPQAHQRAASAPQAPTAPVGAPNIRKMKTNGGPITKGEVRAYIQTHGMPRMSAPAQPFVVTRADLLRSDAISALLQGEVIGAPDAQLLWHVEVRGTFTKGGPPGAPPMTFHRGVEVFDPATGNLLLCGGSA